MSVVSTCHCAGLLTSHSEFTTNKAIGTTSSGYTGYSDASDCYGHGTGVASVAAGGSLGVAQAANVVGLRVCDCSGTCPYSTVIAGLQWISSQAASSGRRSVVAMAIVGAKSTALNTAVAAVVSGNVPVVVPAGNSGVDACLFSPAAVATAITVATTDATDTVTAYSNIGSCVSLFAPGDVVPAAAGAGANTTSLTLLSGTSVSAGVVAGAVARLLGELPALSPASVMSMLTCLATNGTVSGVPSGTVNRLLNGTCVVRGFARMYVRDGGVVESACLPHARCVVPLLRCWQCPNPARSCARTCAPVATFTTQRWYGRGGAVTVDATPCITLCMIAFCV